MSIILWEKIWGSDQETRERISIPQKRVPGKNRSILRKTRRQHGNHGPFHSNRPHSRTICSRRRKHELFEIHCFLYRRRILWVPSLTLLGFFFGNMDIVKKNFELVIFGIIGISRFYQ
jgi:hypothetical protein